MEELFSILFRWLHLFAGILWIGHLYFFNFVNASFAAALDADTKRKVVPELLPRALFWFRWGAFWTWLTGVLLLMVVFYHGAVVFGEDGSWNVPAFLMIAVTFLAPLLYDAAFRAGLGQKKEVAVIVGFLFIALAAVLMSRWAGFSYRGFNIHIGTMLGTTMAFNVWFRIWPSQQKMITAIKEGAVPDSQKVALAGMRSRHNTYLSVPLLWTMINAHTTYFAGGNLGISEDFAWIGLLAVVALSWHLVWQCYKKAGKLKGL